MEFGLKPPHTADEEVEVLRDLVSCLTHPHATVLAYLLAFLSQVSIENPIKTGIANIFGPCLMRPPPNEDEPKNYKEVSKVVLGKLMKYREKVFVGIIARRASENVLATTATQGGTATLALSPSAASLTELGGVKRATSHSPDNNDALLKELAGVIGKQLSDSAAIAKKVEMLKSQLENKYKVNRQTSFQDDSQAHQLANKPNYSSTFAAAINPSSNKSPAYRNAKSVSFVTRPTFNDSQGVCEYSSKSSDNTPQTKHS